MFSSELRYLNPDVIFVDQLSACIPAFRVLCPKAQILFYGHFPDRLLVKADEGFKKGVKMLYRKPFDALESWSTNCADEIVVNSKFTRSVFKQAFPGMRKRELKVVYPCVDTRERERVTVKSVIWPGRKVMLSINRFEGKKNLSLALRAYAGLSVVERRKSKLVIAGGYDSRVAENASTHETLRALADDLKLTHATFRNKDEGMEEDESEVIFLLSVPDELKHRLLSTASLLVYTPQNEHFGIVPLEAMLAGVPVLATNTGGPLETIYDGRTGWLRSPEKVAQWTDVMRKPLIPSSANGLQAMGQKGRERVLAEFSRTKTVQSLEREMEGMCTRVIERPDVVPRWVEISGLAVVIGIVLVARWLATGMSAATR